MRIVDSAKRFFARMFPPRKGAAVDQPAPLLRLYLSHVNTSQKFSSDYWRNRQRHNGKSQHL